MYMNRMIKKIMIFHFSSPLIAKAYDATLIKVRIYCSYY